MKKLTNFIRKFLHLLIFLNFIQKSYEQCSDNYCLNNSTCVWQSQKSINLVCTSITSIPTWFNSKNVKINENLDIQTEFKNDYQIDACSPPNLRRQLSLTIKSLKSNDTGYDMYKDNSACNYNIFVYGIVIYLRIFK